MVQRADQQATAPNHLKKINKLWQPLKIEIFGGKPSFIRQRVGQSPTLQGLFEVALYVIKQGPLFVKQNNGPCFCLVLELLTKPRIYPPILHRGLYFGGFVRDFK